MLLITAGLSNNQIAAELAVATSPVKTHIARLLSKLGLRDRAQIVITAYESGMIQPKRTQPPRTSGRTDR